MNAFSFLIGDGKFNISAIMKHAHTLKAYRRISLSSALKQAWFLAKRQQKEYREVQEAIRTHEPIPCRHSGNLVKAFFLGAHPEYIYYDSSWR